MIVVIYKCDIIKETVFEFEFDLSVIVDYPAVNVFETEDIVASGFAADELRIIIVSCARVEDIFVTYSVERDLAPVGFIQELYVVIALEVTVGSYENARSVVAQMLTVRYVIRDRDARILR